MNLSDKELVALTDDVKRFGYGLVWIRKDIDGKVIGIRHLPSKEAISFPHNVGDGFPLGHYKWVEGSADGRVLGRITTIVDGRDVIKVVVAITQDRVKESLTNSLTERGIK